MADLESLSNAEIRQKCIALGLPNVPVTDSSRKLLLKRLRNAINLAVKEDVSTKPSNRRETMHVVKAPGGEIDSANIMNGAKNRRTIAATSTVVANKEETVSNASTAIPIATRRRSVQKDVEPKPATKRIPETVIIEDDDEELLDAVESLERASTTSSVPTENIPARRKSRSVSVTKVIEATTGAVKNLVMAPLQEERSEIEKPEVVKPVTLQKTTPIVAQYGKTASTTKPTPIPKAQPKIIAQPIINEPQPPTKSTMDYTSRYSLQSTATSVYSTPSMRYSVAGGSIGAAAAYSSAGSIPTYRSKYDILNEQSDDTDANDGGLQSPFLSKFARNLERSKSVGRSSSSKNVGRYARQSRQSNYEIRGRRNQDDITLSELLGALSRKYHFKQIFIGLAILCLVIFVYVALQS